MKWPGIDPRSIEKCYELLNYKMLSRMNELNLFGVRESNPVPNKFNDAIGGLYYTGSEAHLVVYTGTTQPGSYWLEHPMNVKGTAILKPGQHFESHRFGMHHGQYKAFVQNRPLPVWRDNNKDASYDHAALDYGMFGINIHRASAVKESTVVDDWSAGCQVVAAPENFAELVTLGEKHIAAGWPEVFTYTLFAEKEFVEALNS